MSPKDLTSRIRRIKSSMMRSKKKLITVTTVQAKARRRRSWYNLRARKISQLNNYLKSKTRIRTMYHS
jgi:hypothetical protein